MLKLTAATALTIALSGVVLADTPVTTDPAKVEKGAYAVEPTHTQVRFSVNHFGFAPYAGSFNAAQGSLHLDPSDPANSSLDVSVATNSVYTPSDKLTGELKSADWLDAAKFPAVSFKSTKVEKTGADTASILGDLTLHGVTKPVTLQARFYGFGPNPLSKKITVGFEVTGRIKRSEFGVTKYVPLIGDEVDLTISAPFEKQG